MSTINNDDLFLIESNSNNTSYSVKAENLMSDSVVQDDDLLLIERVVDGTPKSFSVKASTIKEDLAPDGVIEEPVVVLTPPNGAGMADEEVTPAAEGITGVSDTTNTATLTYTTDNNLSLLAAGQSMTQQPAYTPVTDTINNSDNY